MINTPPMLLGSLAAGRVTVRAGVCVGECSARTQAMVWEQVERRLEGGDSVMLWRAPTGQGLVFATLGRNRRMPVDFHGLKLVALWPAMGQLFHTETGQKTDRLFDIAIVLKN